MKKLIMTIGLPASGKDFWCKQEMEEHPGVYKRINKDELRILLDFGRWSRINEELIIKVRDNLIGLVLKEGFSVVCTDTNLAEKHLTRLKELAKNYGAEFVIKDFTDVPLETCLDRDEKRPNRVGSKVINQMYRQFLKPKAIEVESDPKLPDAILCDLDGTLALFDTANPYDRDFLKDTVNKPVEIVISAAVNSSNWSPLIILVSGRKSEFREQTEKWLEDNGISYDYLFMRPENDKRKDVIVKQEIYEAEIKGKFNVVFVLDDRNQVVDFWRSVGLKCFQVADGNF